MNLGLWPEAVPFDPDDGAGSQALDEHLAEMAFPRAALVAVGRGLRGSDWAPRAAIGLARSLAAGGREVLLADLDFEAPSLHELLSESALEGLADVLLFGASLERVTVLPAGQLFEFVSTGGYVPDPRALRSDPAWSRLLDEVAARDSVFLGFTQFDAPGLDQLVARIPSVVLLVEPDEAAATAAEFPEQIRIEALIRPPGATGEIGPPEEEGVAPVIADAELPDAEPERIRLPKDEAREALIADLEARERVGRERASVAAAIEPVASEPTPAAGTAGAVTEAGPAVAEARTRRGSRNWMWLAAAAIVVAAAGTTWYFGFRGEEIVEPVASPPQVAQPQAPPEAVGVPLGWSVAVEAHDRLDAANRSVGSLAAADSSLGFYVSPSLVSGDLWYRVLAGPLPDSGAAVVAMNRLVDTGLKVAAAVWDVRETPLAFLLGRFPQESLAIARTDELRESGIPAYIVGVPYSYGDPWYHVYSGAYANSTEADRMRQILRSSGLPDTLVIRVGRAAS